MREKLVITLYANDLTQPGWAVMNEHGALIKNKDHGDAAHLAEEALDRDIVVLVPAEEVLLTTATLPKMNRSRLRQALPYALEEQLVEDVDHLHFAAGEYVGENILPVAVVSREKMQTWLALLQSWQIKPDVMIPLMLAVPVTEETWSVMLSDVALVRTGKASGFMCDKINLANLLSLALKGAISSPREIIIFQDDNESMPLSLPLVVREHRASKVEMRDMLTRGAAETPFINLLQLAYQVKKSRLPKMSQVLKAAMVLTAAWAVLLIFYPVVSLLILQSRVNSVESQMKIIYQRQFPQSDSMIAPRLRLEEKLQARQNGAGDNRLFLLLSNVGKGMNETQGIQLKRIDYANDLLTVELSAPTPGDFSRFTDSLTRQGLSVKQQNANLSGARVNATLQIAIARSA